MKKLNLSRETLCRLSSEPLSRVQGGVEGDPGDGTTSGTETNISGPISRFRPCMTRVCSWTCV